MNVVVPTRQNQTIAYTGKQLDLIRRTVASDCNPTEFDLFLEVARRTELDPFRKHIYAVIYSKNKPDKRKMSIITGIDGFRALAARNKDYRPDENAPKFEYDATLKGDLNPAGIVCVTVKCHKLAPDGQWYPVAGTAYWDEFVPLSEEWKFDQQAGERQPTGIFELSKSSNWFKMPRVMIAKCAESIALRKGWPEDLSGIYGEEEMDRSRAADMTASEAIDAYKTDQRLLLTGGVDSLMVQWQSDMPLEAVPMNQFAAKAEEHVRSMTSLPDLDGWAETNRAPLQRFWAVHKSDALELKKIIEASKAEIAEANRA